MSHNPLTALVEENKRYFTFFNISIALVLITGAEIAIIEMPTHWGINLTILGILSLVKFFCVVAWFMHLRWDKALCSLLFVMGLVIAVATYTAVNILFMGDHFKPQTEDVQTAQVE
jgi:cytochrome c oxidase subunit IV